MVTVCADIYSFVEVDTARNVLAKYVSSKRISKSTDSDKTKKLLIDLLKIILDSNLCLPVFYAVDLSRLPPVDIEHVDVAALMNEMSLLRAEVRGISRLKEDVCSLQRTVEDLMSERREVKQAISARDVGRSEGLHTINMDMLNHKAVMQFDPCQDDGGATSFASHAINLKTGGMRELKPVKQIYKPVYGKAHRAPR